MVDIITDPTKALIAADREPKRLWLPFILAMFVPVVLSVYYFSTIDMNWMFQQMQAATSLKGEELPDEMREFFSSSIMMGGAIAATIVMVAVFTSLSALYLLMVAKFSSEDKRSFGKWFSLSAWVSVPNTLAALLMIVYFAVMGSSQIGFEELSFFSLNALVMHYPSGTSEAGFFVGITPFLIWSIVLLAQGINIWTSRTFGKSLLIAVLPFLVIYGGWGVAVL